MQALLLLLLLLVQVSLQQPVIRRVASQTGADSGNCITVPCKSISYGISQANSNDAVHLDGLFLNEQVVISKNLTLQASTPFPTILENFYILFNASQNLQVHISNIHFQNAPGRPILELLNKMTHLRLAVMYCNFTSIFSFANISSCGNCSMEFTNIVVHGMTQSSTFVNNNNSTLLFDNVQFLQTQQVMQVTQLLSFVMNNCVLLRTNGFRIMHIAHTLVTGSKFLDNENEEQGGALRTAGTCNNITVIGCIFEVTLEMYTYSSIDE